MDALDSLPSVEQLDAEVEVDGAVRPDVSDMLPGAGPMAADALDALPALGVQPKRRRLDLFTGALNRSAQHLAYVRSAKP